MDKNNISKQERISLILELLYLYDQVEKEKEESKETLPLIPVAQKVDPSVEIEGCYEVSDIERILSVSRPAVYDLIKKKEFPVKRVGKTYRIPKEPFNEWCRKIEED